MVSAVGALVLLADFALVGVVFLGRVVCLALLFLAGLPTGGGGGVRVLPVCRGVTGSGLACGRLNPGKSMAGAAEEALGWCCGIGIIS